MQNAEDRKHESEGMRVHDDERDALKDLEQARQIKDREDESIGMERHDHHHIDKDPDIKGGIDNTGFPHLLREIKKMHLRERVGQLYSELDPDHLPELADHMEEIRDLQDDLKDLEHAARVGADRYDKVSDDLKKQRDTNTKLMYEQLRRSENDLLKKDPSSKLDDKLEHITLDED